jgi:hypothetical protein
VFGLETDIQATDQKGSSSLSRFIPGIPCILEFDVQFPACLPRACLQLGDSQISN